MPKRKAITREIFIKQHCEGEVIERTEFSDGSLFLKVEKNYSIHAYGFEGKAARPAFWQTAKKDFITSSNLSCVRWKERVIERIAEKQKTLARHAIDPQVGDWLYYSSGYGMLDPNFFKVIKRAGKTVTVQAYDDKIVSYDNHAGTGTKIPGDKPQGFPMKKVLSNGTLSFRGGHFAQIWDKTPVYFSDMD